MNEGKDKIILDYEPRPRHYTARKWLRRTFWFLLVVSATVAMPLSWLFVGWQAEQGPIRRIESNGGEVSIDVIPVPVLSRFLPRHLQWLESRVTGVGLSSTQGDAELRDLKRLTNLQWLGLPNTKVTDEGLVHLKGLTNLQELGLMYTRVTDEGLVHLKGLTNLQELTLTDTPVTDGGLVHLKGLTNLQGLWLSNTQVADEGLVHLKGLTNLRELRLDDTQVTDKGLVHLKGLTNLRVLDLSDTRVTDDGRAELQKALPNCGIGR